MIGYDLRTILSVCDVLDPRNTKQLCYDLKKKENNMLSFLFSGCQRYERCVCSNETCSRTFTFVRVEQQILKSEHVTFKNGADSGVRVFSLYPIVLEPESFRSKMKTIYNDPVFRPRFFFCCVRLKLSRTILNVVKWWVLGSQTLDWELKWTNLESYFVVSCCRVLESEAVNSNERKRCFYYKKHCTHLDLGETYQKIRKADSRAVINIIY